MKSQIIPTQTPALFAAAVNQAAALLRAGELVALPTETVYGLAANALDPQAVARIFQVKGRPAHNPIIVHVASEPMARSCAAEWPSVADKLARAFWPGPLTLVLPRGETIPEIVTAGGPTVGLRWPSHPFIQAVVKECGFPLAAPSANLANRVSPTTADHVRRSIGDRIGLIVDGGPAQVGIESTVLDISVWPPRVLRPGMIHDQALLAVTGKLQWREESSAAALRSPGLLRRHYSPKARLVVWSWTDEAGLREKSSQLAMPLHKIHVIAHSRVPSAPGFGGVFVIPHDAIAFARAIYAALHECDQAGAELIVVEKLPAAAEWRAVADRLRRAGA